MFDVFSVNLQQVQNTSSKQFSTVAEGKVWSDL